MRGGEGATWDLITKHNNSDGDELETRNKKRWIWTVTEESHDLGMIFYANFHEIHTVVRCHQKMRIILKKMFIKHYSCVACILEYEPTKGYPHSMINHKPLSWYLMKSGFS